MSAVLPAPGFFGKDRITAPVSYNRWLVPPAALAVHLCIGMAYGFSVFWLPLSRAVGIKAPISCPRDMSVIEEIFVTNCDWKVSMLGWTFTLFFVLLGCSAALWGKWLERVGPRKAGIVAASCWCGGFVISACAVKLHQLTLLWLGSGVIGGIGLGLGYISPVSMLVKWFPDRRGMATGLAIMGFGGGAVVGAPLADLLMQKFATETDVGVWKTFLVLAATYWIFMTGGALGYRLPPPGWRPPGWEPPSSRRSLGGDEQVHPDVAVRTGQFWLLWAVLMLNVTAGIGILGMASPLVQEVFGGRLIGINASFDQLTPQQLQLTAAVAAGFTGLLSLFNTLGRIFWSSLSDFIGRQGTYLVFFLVGLTLYASIPWTVSEGLTELFVAFFCVILSMYGGGFAAVPAYLTDLFGTRMVGAIHGRLLTAWATAGVLGPVLVNYIREYQLDHGVPPAYVYSITMYILAGLLAVGLVCNVLIRAVDEKHQMTRTELTELDAAERSTPPPGAVLLGAASTTPLWLAVLAWVAVCAPLAWGIWVTLQQTAVLFQES
jgi:MFS family permease